jgi:hypothetical protein
MRHIRRLILGSRNGRPEARSRVPGVWAYARTRRGAESTSNMPLSLAARCARVMPVPSAQRAWRPPQREGAARPSTEGAGNAGCPMHPQPRARMVVKNAHEYSQRGHRNRPAFPHAMVLTASFVLSPAIGPFAAVASRIKVLPGPVEPNEPPQDLTPASRRQDHTTSPYAATRLRQKASPGLAPFVLRAGDRSRRAIRPAIPSHA